MEGKGRRKEEAEVMRVEGQGRGVLLRKGHEVEMCRKRKCEC